MIQLVSFGALQVVSFDRYYQQGKNLEQTLELSDIILTLADDLYTSCIISEYNPIDTPEKRQWYERYCEMSYKRVQS